MIPRRDVENDPAGEDRQRRAADLELLRAVDRNRGRAVWREAIAAAGNECSVCRARMRGLAQIDVRNGGDGARLHQDVVAAVDDVQPRIAPHALEERAGRVGPVEGEIVAVEHAHRPDYVGRAAGEEFPLRDVLLRKLQRHEDRIEHVQVAPLRRPERVQLAALPVRRNLRARRHGAAELRPFGFACDLRRVAQKVDEHRVARRGHRDDHRDDERDRGRGALRAADGKENRQRDQRKRIRRHPGHADE